MTVAFYISGHGFGHASRQVEIINAFAARRPGARIMIRSAAARWLLERTIEVPFDLDPRPCDTGVVQIDSLHLDEAATIAAAREFYATFDARADAEARTLQELGTRLVIVDAPPLGCEAAARAGIPSVVVSNFTWDWIYAGYPLHIGDATGLIDTIQQAYRKATAAWRLPMHGGFETFLRSRRGDRRPPLIDVPFVARHATREPEETRARLGLPLDRNLVLPSFGGYGVTGLDLTRLDLDDGWHVIDGLADAAVYDAGLSYEDLVSAVEVIVTKPGYGILSECIANDTAVVFTPRGRFREYDVLVREMPRYLRCAELDTSSLMAGRWRQSLEAALSSPPPPEHPATNGAEVIAELMQSAGSW